MSGLTGNQMWGVRLRGCETKLWLNNHLLSQICRTTLVSQSHDQSHKVRQGQLCFAVMAMNGSPTINEPPTSYDGPLPSISSLSPHPSSSSDSFDSSRPTSQGSSATSRSVSPSPLSIPKSVPVIDNEESVELPALPSNPPLPENTSASQSHQQNDPPRSVPPASAVSPRVKHEAAWLSRLRSLIPRKGWVGNALGIMSLGLTLIGMIIFGERTYKLAVWSAWNDALDTCGQLNSVSGSILRTIRSTWPFLTLL